MLNKDKPVQVIVDKDKCTKCGFCLKTCESYLIKDENGYPMAKSAKDTLLGCIQCGRCMMKCPVEAIEIIGEDIDKTHLRPMPQNIPDYEAFNSLLLKRRSCRRFKPEELSKENIDKILASAATAPIGIAPSEVKVMVFQGRKKVQEFAQDLNSEIRHMQKIMTPFALKLMKVFMSENKYKVMKDFVLPLCEATVKESEKGNDILFYDAPAVMVFYGTELVDKEEIMIPATTATLAAEALGIGTCFIGSVAYFLNNSSKLKKKYGIQKGEKAAMAFILGMPDEGYYRTFQRNFKEIKIIQ